MSDIHNADLLSIRQVANLLQVSERSVFRWIASGQLPAERLGVKSGRIRRFDVDALLTPITSNTTQQERKSQ